MCWDLYGDTWFIKLLHSPVGYKPINTWKKIARFVSCIEQLRLRTSTMQLMLLFKMKTENRFPEIVFFFVSRDSIRKPKEGRKTSDEGHNSFARVLNFAQFSYVTDTKWCYTSRKKDEDSIRPRPYDPWHWVYKRIQFTVITEEDYSMQNVICFVTVVQLLCSRFHVHRWTRRRFLDVSFGWHETSANSIPSAHSLFALLS